MPLHRQYKAWHETCISLSSKSDPKSVYSIPRFVADSTSFSSSYSKFSHWFSPMQTASVYTRDFTFPCLSKRICVAEFVVTYLSSTWPRTPNIRSTFLSGVQLYSHSPTGQFPVESVYFGSSSLFSSVNFGWIYQTPAELSDDSCYNRLLYGFLLCLVSRSFPHT